MFHHKCNSLKLGHVVTKGEGAMTPPKGCVIIITFIIIKRRLNTHKEGTIPSWGCDSLSKGYKVIEKSQHPQEWFKSSLK
jgi:hypothetical protein